MNMGKASIIEPKRKGLIVPWLMITLALITIISAVYAFFWIESTRWYSNPGNTSTAVLVFGAIIAMPLLFIGLYFVGRNTKFNDRIDEITLSMKLEGRSLIDRPQGLSAIAQRNSISNKPIVEPTSAEKQDVRNEIRGEEKLEFACPICETIVSMDDSICPHCGSQFEEIPEPSEPEAEDEKNERTAKAAIGMMIHCSQCGKILIGGKFCKYCAAKVG